MNYYRVSITLKMNPIPSSIKIVRRGNTLTPNEYTISGRELSFLVHDIFVGKSSINVQYHPAKIRQ